jgi:hypothetical protein
MISYRMCTTASRMFHNPHEAITWVPGSGHTPCGISDPNSLFPLLFSGVLNHFGPGRLFPAHVSDSTPTLSGKEQYFYDVR